ncbi:response regulator [Azospirillum sp. SYSU D00513]|uniref:response regulator n=1 Tax=Azospirillum sp. SYSU D00513 TaxID=2812561 RepID=UPI001A976E59|nr:response regulator [Azospirillum sp. SYSU D00513]
MRILLIEDEVLIAMEQRFYLESDGHEVIGPAPTSHQGIAMGLAERPDLALVDIHLAQKTSGIDAARRLTAEGIPCLFVTSFREEVRASLDFAIGCLSKPFSEASLIAAVHAVQAILAGEKPKSVPKAMELFT